jgi:alpha-1,6-mannosyltransferase
LLPVDAAVYALKAASAASVLAIAAIVSRLARRRGVEPLRAAAFVGLNPLVLAHVVGGPHNDGFAILAMTVGVAAVLEARGATAGVAFVTSVAIKVSAGFAAPFAVLGLVREQPLGVTSSPATVPRRAAGFLAGALLAAALVGAVSYFAFGWSWIHPLVAAASDQAHTSHLSVPTTFARVAGLGKGTAATAALVLYGLLIAYLLAWTWRGGDWVRAAAWAGTGLLLATSWLLPWYVLWPLPLVALARDRTLTLVVLLLTAYQLAALIPL